MKSSLQIVVYCLSHSFRYLNRHAKLLLALAAFGISNFAFAATISSTAVGGDWSIPATWVGGVIPTSSDDVLIVSGSTVVIRTPYTSSTPAACNSITIDGTLTIGSGSTTPRQLNVQTFLLINASGTLDQGGSAYNQIFIAGDFTNNGTLSPTGNAGSLNFTFNGTTGQVFNSSSSTIILADIIINKTAGQSLTFGGGITTLSANAITLTSGIFVSPTVLSTAGDMKLTAGAYTAGSSTVLGGNFTNDGATFSPGSGAVTFFGGSQVIGGSKSTTFNHLITSGASATTISTSAIVNGDLTINDGTSLSVFPDITVNGKTVVGNGLSGSLIMSSTVGSKVFNGLVTIKSGATWNNTADENVHFVGGVTNQGTIIPGNGIYFFETSAQEINGSVNVTNADVAIALTNKGTFTVGSSLQGVGNVVQTANSILNIGGSSTITTITAAAAGNSVNYYGVAQSIKGINYVNLGFSGDAAKSLSTSTTSISGNLTLSGTVSTTTVISLTIGGNLNIGDGSTFTAAGNDITVTGTTTIGNGFGGTLVISSTAGSKTFAGLVTISPGATWNNAVGENPHFQNGIQNDGTFIDGSGTNFFEVNNQSLKGTISIGKVDVATGITLTNNGTLTTSTDLSVNGTFAQGLNSVLNIVGTSSINSLDANSVDNTVNYTGANQSVRGFNYYNLGLSGSGTKTLLSGISTITGNLTLSGTVNSGTSNALSVGGDFLVGDGTMFNANGFDFTVGGMTIIGGGASGNLNFTSLVGVKTFVGLVTISAGATWNNATNNEAITLQGGILLNGIFQAGTGIYTFDTNPQSLTGSFSISNVVINGIAVTNNTSLTVGSISGTGSLTQGTGAPLSINGTSLLASIDASALGNTVTYNFSSPSIISGSYNDLVVNQSSGDATLGGNISVTGILTLSTGNLNISASNLTLGNAASVSIASPSAARMIIASGGGEVRKTFSTTGSFTFPIGDNVGTIEYSPITIDVTASSSPGYVGVNVTDDKSAFNASTSDYLTRYWNITESGITGCIATVNATYLPVDISGSEANIKAAQLDGVFNQVTNGWKRFSVLSNNILTATGVSLTNTQTSVLTGIASANPSVSITGGGVAVCSGTPVSLGATVNGIAPITYSWSPSSGLSAADVANPTATVLANNVANYTLTIYDANGISATDNTTITSQQPTITVGDISICSGSSKDLTASGASTYSWSPSTGLSSASGATVTANPTITTPYTVTGTDANNCTNTATVTVTVVQLPAKPTISGSGLNTVNPLLTSSSASGNQWFKGGVIINGATNTTYQPTSDGSYTVQVTANACAGPLSDPFTFILTATERVNGSGNIRLFPVPTEKQLTIDWAGFLPEILIEVRIYDLLGRTVLSQTMMTNENSLDVGHLSSGQLIFQAAQGSQISTQRFMKK